MMPRFISLALTAVLVVQSGAALAWFPWCGKDGTKIGSRPSWGLGNAPIANPYPNPAMPGIWAFRPGPIPHRIMPRQSGGIFVHQTQSAAGYHIRVHTPGGRRGDLEIIPENGAIHIQSSAQADGMGQWSWSKQWVELPADADLAAMRISAAQEGLDIFVPRRH